MCVCVCVCVCVCTCMYVCMNVCMCVCVCVCVCLCVCECVCVLWAIPVQISPKSATVCVCVCICVCMHVRACMYVSGPAYHQVGGVPSGAWCTEKTPVEMCPYCTGKSGKITITKTVGKNTGNLETLSKHREFQVSFAYKTVTNH